jgi:hypothetical protein
MWLDLRSLSLLPLKCHMVDDGILFTDTEVCFTHVLSKGDLVLISHIILTVVASAEAKE